MDEALSKLLSAQRLLQLGESWLVHAYLSLKDSQPLWEAWCHCLLAIVALGVEEEDRTLATQLSYALKRCRGLQLSDGDAETRMREDEVLCDVRKVQTEWLQRHRNIAAPRRLKQMQAAQVAQCSFRAGLKAGQAAQARKRKGGKKSGQDSAEGQSEAQGEEEETLTEERVRQATTGELKALAQLHGSLPVGRSRFKKPDWLKHVLLIYGFSDDA